jgi:ATP-dependent exoDNAse (exonuclease V) beta subunit
MSSAGQDVTRDYVRALEARRIPHVLVGGRSFFLREEVGALLNALVAIEWPDDELSVYATLRGPFFAFADDALLVARDAWKGLNPTKVPTLDEADESAPVARALAILRTLHRGRNRRPIADTVSALLEAVRAHASVAIWPTGEQALGNLLRVLDMARRFERSGTISFRSFVEQMRRDRDHGVIGDATVVEDTAEGVRMMTAHKAKGLEFPVVILADPAANATHREPSRFVDNPQKLCAFPVANCMPQELRDHSADVLSADAAESVRLLYVAATRARDLLVVPGIGETHEPGLLGWVEPLARVLSPTEYERLGSKACPGVPSFPARGVTDRPHTARNATDPIVSPGLHRRQGFGVVWWDTHALSLNVESDHILRQESMLVADDSGGSSSSAYAEWVKRKSAALAQGAIPSRRVVTVTALSKASVGGAVGSTYVRRDEGFASVRGPRFGTLVHEVLAHVPLDADDAMVADHVDWVARTIGAPPGERAAAISVVGNALLHPLLVKARAAAEVRREVGLAMTLESGELVEGVVDLAFGDDSGWTVIDFKTGEASSELRSVYEAQVALYVQAIDAAGKLLGTTRGILLYL